MNDWLAAGYIAFFVLLAGYLIRLTLLERGLRRERERLTASEAPRDES
jgi:hypothetical protein